VFSGKTLFIFVDESGNFDFRPAGSRYWSITALCTFDPISGRDSLMRLLYELAAAGGGQEYFHATEDCSPSAISFLSVQSS